MPNWIYEYCGVVKCLRQKMQGGWEIPFLGGRQPLKRGDERYVKLIVIEFKKDCFLAVLVSYNHLLYKHQWNTKWAFPRKLHIFTREITCYLHMWRDHRRYGYIINRGKMVWYFTGVYIINRILHARLWIWILSSRGQLDISDRVDHSKIKFISTRGHVISSMYSMLVVCAPQCHVTDWLIFLTNNYNYNPCTVHKTKSVFVSQVRLIPKT